MKILDEVHLLNVSVAKNFQNKGVGRFFLDKEIMTTSYKDDADIHTDNLAASAHQAKHLTIFNDFFITSI